MTKIYYFFSRIFFLASIVIFQFTLAYTLNYTKFAHVSFGFSILNISMILFSFGFNQFLMYVFSRSKKKMSEICRELFPLYIYHCLMVYFVLTILLVNLYDIDYAIYGIYFLIIGFLFSLRDFTNTPNLVLERFKKVITSNIFSASFLYLASSYVLLTKHMKSANEIDLEHVIIFMISCLFFVVLFYDLRLYFASFNLNSINFFKSFRKNRKILKGYIASLPFGLSVALFALYYQSPNLIIPIFQSKKAVAAFGIIYLYLGIIYLFSNIIFNQILLPPLFLLYRKNFNLYVKKTKQYIIYFLILGCTFMLVTLVLPQFLRLNLFNLIIQKYSLITTGLPIISIGILSRFIATPISGHLTVMGAIMTKVLIQATVAVISIIASILLIPKWGVLGGCVSYSLTEFTLLLLYLISLKKVNFSGDYSEKGKC